MVEPIEVNFNKFEGTVTYKNIGFLGQCYDFIKLDPLDLSLPAKNGGGAISEWAVEIKAADCTEKIPDASVLIPKGTKYIPQSRGERSSRTETWFSAYDFSDSFSNTVSSGFSIPGIVSFSYSKTYSELCKTAGSNEKIETYVQSYFEDCSIRFNDGSLNSKDGLKFSTAFSDAVAKLDADSSYTDFIKRFGTHYAHEVTFGGRMFQRIRISTQTYKQLIEKGTDVSAAAEASYKNATASASAGSSSSSSRALENSSGINVDELKWVGGTPQSNFDEWVKTIREDPKPVELDLKPLYELFTSTCFPSDKSIQTKQQKMKAAVEKYLKENAQFKPVFRDLDNKEFYVRNRWRADVGEKRVNDSLSFYSDNVQLAKEDDTKNMVPWLVVPVPDMADEFYLLSQWNKAEGDRRVNYSLGFLEDNAKLYDKNDAKNLVSWKFIPVPGKPGEFYLRSRWRALKGDRRTDFSLGFCEDNAKLYDKNDYYNLVPWKFEPVAKK